MMLLVVPSQIEEALTEAAVFCKINFFNISFLLIPGAEVSFTWAPSELLFLLVNPCEYFVVPTSLAYVGI